MSRYSSHRSGRILAAFDRRDHVRFRTQFLATLRESGNVEPVWAFAYGLFPDRTGPPGSPTGRHGHRHPRQRCLPGAAPAQGLSSRSSPAGRAETPVAYWDAGDILFQDRLGPLWDLVAASPDLLLVTEEPKSYPDNPVIRHLVRLHP